MHFATRVGQNLPVDGVEAAAHPWGYFPLMTPSEAIYFITFDSARHAEEDGVGVVHTAFDDPSISADVPRRSVELRTVAIWDE